MIRNINNWIHCKKVLFNIQRKNTQFVISNSLQNFMIKPEKLQNIKDETSKLSIISLTKSELNLGYNNLFDIAKVWIRNDPKFDQWIKINLIFEEKDLIKNNFLERIFKLPTKIINSYESDNILDIYSSKYKNNSLESSILIQNIRDHYSIKSKLLLPKSKIIIDNKESHIIKKIFQDNTFIVVYENIINDYHFYINYKRILDYSTLIKSSNLNKNKIYIFMNEKKS